MLRLLSLLIFITLSLPANSLVLNPNSIGRGGVDMALGGSSNSIFSNPSNLTTIGVDELVVEPIDSSIALNEDTLDFLTELSSDADNSKKVSALMKKNIGKTLSFRANNFASIYKTPGRYSWLFGLQNDISGYFITHSGFGSIGAMESYIERYRSAVGTLSFSQNSLSYGVNIRAIEKYQTIHNYSIGEMIESDSFMEYFDNEYTQKEEAVALDTGISYKLPNAKLAFSILNIGDTSFKEIGEIPSTTNIGFSSNYRKFLFGMDYIDLFGAEYDANFEDSIRFGISRSFFDDSLTLSSGILYEGLTFGVDYRYSILNISLSSFKEKEYNSIKNRKYQLSLSLAW
ncbi:hypothetical protein GSY74_00875 [Sulfurovum sp. bin170]|uniref:hypothetical protein n=1 Tax=Sulfurovum sp. bin170 TaxID=2695268 RepID=UPI0013E074B4|nr:hypothetical protein [Sulfurovum sp. bin170]NEW59821.1 hypothetical protein [Sulfurovum sp. bin170]